MNVELTGFMGATLSIVWKRGSYTGREKSKSDGKKIADFLGSAVTAATAREAVVIFIEQYPSFTCPQKQRIYKALSPTKKSNLS